jgi:hypothetical protein
MLETLKIVWDTAIFVAFITLFGVIITAIVPKLIDYWIEKRKEARGSNDA